MWPRSMFEGRFGAAILGFLTISYAFNLFLVPGYS